MPAPEPQPLATSTPQPEPGPRVRSVPGGYDINALPIRVRTLPGESAASYLRRFASRYGITPRDALCLVPPRPGRMPMPEPRTIRIAQTRSYPPAPTASTPIHPAPAGNDDGNNLDGASRNEGGTVTPRERITPVVGNEEMGQAQQHIPDASVEGRATVSPVVADRRTGRASTAALTAKTIDTEADAWLDEPYGLTLTADEIRGLTDRPLDTALSTYLDLYHRPKAAPPPWRQRRKAHPAPRGSRYCPRCLEETGAWASDWQNPIAVVCVNHSIWLLDICPDCGRRLFTDNAWLAQDAPAWTCPSRLNASDPRLRPHPRAHRPWCGHDLRTARTTPVASEIIESQAYLLDLARTAARDPHATVPACGLHIPAQIALDAYLQLLEALTPANAITARSTTRAARIAPQLIPPAQVLTRPDIDTARARLGKLLSMTSPHAPVAITRDVGARPYNPLVAMLQLSHHASRMTPANQLRLRIGSAAPRYPLPKDPRDRKVARLRLIDAGQHPREPRLEWIPQTLWPTHRLTGIDPRNPDHLAVAALAAARTTTTKPFGVLALELGLPTTTANTVGATWRRLHRSDQWHAFLHDLDLLITQLQRQPPPIDYRRRRIIGDDTDLLDHALQHARRDACQCEKPAAPNGHHRDHPRPWPVDDLRRRFWELFTGGDIAFAPPPLQLAAGTPERARHCALRPAIDDEHRCCFSTAHELLRQSLAPYLSGPLTWTPP